MPLWAQGFNRELRVPLGKRLTGCATRPLPQQKGATFAIVVLHFVWWLQLVSKPCYTNKLIIHNHPIPPFPHSPIPHSPIPPFPHSLLSASIYPLQSAFFQEKYIEKNPLGLKKSQGGMARSHCQSLGLSTRVTCRRFPADGMNFSNLTMGFFMIFHGFSTTHELYF